MSVLVGRVAPDFTAPAVGADGKIIDKFNLHEQIKKKYAIVFFYPLDFTFVCPSELIALSHRIKEFQHRGVEVIGVSIDSHYTHNAYRNTPVEKGGIGPISFPLVADMSHAICKAYGIQHPEAGVALRAVFVIDKAGIVRSQIVNDLPIGRNMDEILRIIDAVQFNEEHGEVCPAGWTKGQSGMVASPEGVANYLANHASDL